jgi:site-specific DNA recombinase
MNAGIGQKVAIYARVSSQEQATEGVSIDAQIAALKAYAKSQGWEIIDEYIDGGYSGGTDDRPAFKRMLSDARQKRFDIIAVCKLDRFFRNLRLLLNYIYELEQLGIKFVSTQEGLDTSSPYGKFAVQIMGVIAEFERGRIGERVKDSRHYLIAQGKWPGGRPPFGYRWLAQERKWEVIPAEAEIVRRIFDLYVNEKVGIDAISKTLNDEGLLTRNRALWRFSTVRSILTHPGYNGQHQTGIAMPPLIDETTWQIAQERRATARSVLADPKGWLLQGMIFCGECGLGLKCIQKRNSEYRYYACRGRIERRLNPGEAKRCGLPYIRADKLESAVWSRIRDVLSNREKLAECVNKALADLEAKKSQVGTEALAINDKLEAIRARKERLGIAFADGTVNESLYREMLTTLKKQEANLLKSRHDIDPSQIDEITAFEARIKAIKDILSKGELVLNEFGMYAMEGNHYLPLGFNAFRESDGKLAIGEIETKKIMVFEGEYPIYLWDVIDPPAYYECDDSNKRADVVIKNIRAIMQLFNIKAFVYSDRVEIKGAIPPQLLELKTVKESFPAPVISSPRGTQGEDCKILRWGEVEKI